MTPVARIHPARRTLLGIVVGVRTATSAEGKRAGRVADLIVARIALYRGRDSQPLGLDVELAYPKAGAYQPEVGDRMHVAIEPTEA